jgi:hypothetical protein
MTGDKELNATLDAIDRGIIDFQDGIPEIQRRIYERLILLQKELQIQGGTITNSAKNIRLLSRIKADLYDIIFDDTDYMETVTQFSQLYGKVDQLNAAYFKALEKKFKPSKIVPEIRKQSVSLVLENLTEAGLEANLINPVREIINTYVTTGGSYAKLATELQNYITGYDSDAGRVEGQLQKFTRQITTDAINQYSATVNEVMTQDLGWEWYRYQGSNVRDTRTFCEALKKKKYFHRSELNKIIKGDFEEFRALKGKIYDKTGLPQGMYDDTNTSNFLQYRGGYNCGHQAYPIPTALVPASVRAALK